MRVPESEAEPDPETTDVGRVRLRDMEVRRQDGVTSVCRL